MFNNSLNLIILFFNTLIKALYYLFIVDNVSCYDIFKLVFYKKRVGLYNLPFLSYD